MKFIQGILSMLVLSIVFADVSSASPQELLVITPDPKPVSMSIREFHECVACNENENARKDFEGCLSILSEENRKLGKECCEKTYDSEFCQKAFDGKINFPLVCQNPQKAIEADRCFWEKVNKNTSDIESVRKCKLGILENYCTVRSIGGLQ